jgi:hypothetical protein
MAGRGENQAGTAGLGCNCLKYHGIELWLVVGLMLMAVWTTRAAGFGAGAKGFVHNLADGAGATAALGAASETAVNLPRRARLIFGHGIAHVVVGKDVAGANDHGMI